MSGSVGKLSRGSLSYNKNYKPNGLKAYARAALKCLSFPGCRDDTSETDIHAQTISVPRSKVRFVPSRKSDKLGSSATTSALAARPVSMVMYLL